MTRFIALCALILSASGTVQAAITYVKTVGTVNAKGAAATTTTFTVGASGASAGNNIIIAIVVGFSAGEDAIVPTCADTKGNTYTTDVDFFNQATAATRTAICSSRLTTSLITGDVITVTHASQPARALSIDEFSGLAAASPLDKTAGDFGSSLNALSALTATTMQADELVFGAVGVRGPVAETYTKGASYTALTRDGTTGASATSNRTINPEYKIVSSTGTYAADGTLGTSTAWIAVVATYKAAAGATTLGDGAAPAGRNVGRSTSNRAVDAFTLSTGSGSDTLTGLTVTLSGTGTAADIAASGVKIWKDNGTVANEWDAGDTQIGSGVSVSGATATFTGLTESITTTSTQYLITYDISAAATLGNTLLGAVTAATTTNTLTNNDTTDNTLVVAAVSGTVYTDAGTTNIGSGKTVRLIKNGTSIGTDTTDAVGRYAVAGTVAAADAILVYIDNDATYRGNTVTISNGAALSGLDIYHTHLITRQDNGGSLSNANLATAVGAYSDSSDILYSVATNNLIVSGASWTLNIPTGQSYIPGGNITTPNMTSVGTFSGGAGSITVQGNLLISGGSYTATSGTTMISSFFTISGGSFIHNSGRVTFTSTGLRQVNTGAASLNNVTLDYSASQLDVIGTMNVSGNLTITTAGTLGSGTIAVAGNVTTTDSDVVGAGTITFNGTGAQTLSASGGTGALPGVIINKASGTLTIQDTINVDGISGWSYTNNGANGADVSAGISTVVFRNAMTVNSGATAFNNVSINSGAGGTLTVTGTATVSGNLTITSIGAISGGTIAVAGNLTSTDTTVMGTAAITLNGAGTQAITATGADLPDGTLTINKASGTATLASALTLNGAGQDLTVTSGTLDLAGYNLVLTSAGDVLTVGAAGTLQLQGGETVTASTKTFNAGSTVIYNGGATYASLILGNTYSNLTFSNATGSWTHTGALTANNLTITAGTLISGGQSINVSGNWSNSGTYTSGANTVTFNGTAQSITGNTTFNNFTKSVAAADTLTFAASSTTTINGLASINGAAGQLLSLRSSSTPTRWKFNLGSSAAKTISYVDVQDSDASGSAAAQKPVSPTNSTDSGNTISWFNNLVIVKQAWEENGSAPLTSPLAAPVGSTLVFLIYVKNTAAGAISDVRINDSLDETGFQYVAGSLIRTNAATPPTDVATDLAIFNATAPGTGTNLSDAVDADMASGQNTGGLADVDKITVGAVAGQANGSLSIAGQTTFAVRFKVRVK